MPDFSSRPRVSAPTPPGAWRAPARSRTSAPTPWEGDAAPLPAWDWRGLDVDGPTDRAGDPSRVSMWSPGRPAPGPVERVLRGTGRPLPPGAAELLDAHGVDLDEVRLHADEQACEAAMMLDARAFTAGSHIVFGPGQLDLSTGRGRELMRHELGHVVQGGGRAGVGRPVMAESPSREAAASAGSAVPATSGALVLQRHPAEKVLKFAARWLSRKSAKYITKHIARHTRTIAGRAIHSVFRNPRRMKEMVTRAVREATEVVERRAETLATHAVEEGSIRVTRQATRTPGKVRWVVEKTFGEAIGTAGERVLRIVIDQTGRIVTAFPADRLLALGLTVGAVEALTARTAEAAETVRSSVERQSALEEAASRPPESSWWEWVPIVGDIWGGDLNSGEREILAARDEARNRDRIIRDVVAASVADIEADLQATLGPEKRADVEEFVRMVLASGIDVAEDL